MSTTIAIETPPAATDAAPEPLPKVIIASEPSHKVIIASEPPSKVVVAPQASTTQSAASTIPSPPTPPAVVQLSPPRRIQGKARLIFRRRGGFRRKFVDWLLQGSNMTARIHDLLGHEKDR